MKSLKGLLYLNWSLLALCCLLSGCSKPESPRPYVIATDPANAATDVDPARDSISVTFNKPMRARSWSWGSESNDSFPEVNGEPAYDEAETTCTLPVILEPEKKYIILINPGARQNFIDTEKNPAISYRFEFTTGSEKKE